MNTTDIENMENIEKTTDSETLLEMLMEQLTGHADMMMDKVGHKDSDGQLADEISAHPLVGEHTTEIWNDGLEAVQHELTEAETLEPKHETVEPEPNPESKPEPTTSKPEIVEHEATESIGGFVKNELVLENTEEILLA